MEGTEVAAYFDLDGTLLDASSEKTLTAYLTKKDLGEYQLDLYLGQPAILLGY